MVGSHVCCQPRCATHVPCLNCRRNDHKADLLCSCSAQYCGVSRELSDTPCRRGGDEAQRRRLYDVHPFPPPTACAYLCWTKCTAGFGVLDTERADNAPGQPNGTKSLATTIPSRPGYHSPRIITVSPSSHSQMGRAGTLLWWRSINSPGITTSSSTPRYCTPLRILFMASTLTGDCRHGRGHDGRIKTTPTHDAPSSQALARPPFHVEG